MNKTSLVLLSGGLDSTVTGYIAKEESNTVYGLTFVYGQRHQRETQAASKIGKNLQLKDHVFFTLDLSQFGGSTLFHQSKHPVPTPKHLQDIGKQIPSTYVPARNTIFLSIGLAYAETIDADAIYIGVTAEDYSGYPDCRPEYINTFQHLINVATKKTIQNSPIILHTPLLKLTKKEIIQKGDMLHAPFQHTWSCYRGEDVACGTCDTCLLRLKGFKQANIPDPIPYQTTPDWYDLK